VLFRKTESSSTRTRRAKPLARGTRALRVCLTVSAHGYNDAQLPELVAGTVHDVAAVRTLFPFDFYNLMVFHPGSSNSREETRSM
jgi:hypothetical protein